MENIWNILDNQIVNRTGEPFSPEDIFAALDEDDGQIIRADLQGLRFLKLPLELVILIDGSPPENLELSVSVLKNGQFFPVNLTNSQLIINNTWHAILPTSQEQVQRTLERHDLQVGAITFGKYLKLRLDTDINSLIKDRSSIDEDEDSWNILSAIEPPHGLKATLYPYQRSGSAVLRTLQQSDLGGLLADEMGLGKTIQVIALLLDCFHKGPSLVIMPASLLRNWENEIHKFAPSLETLIHAGTSRTGIAKGFDGIDVVLCSYDTAVNDWSLMQDVNWNVIALDEAQAIKNPEAQRSQIIKKFDCRVPVAITGTPVENYLTDLWSIYEFILPELLGSRELFEQDFEDTVDAAEELGRIVSNFTIRRKVTEVAKDLPSISQALISFDLPTDVQSKYDEIYDPARAFEVTTTLRTLCAHSHEDFSSSSFSEAPKVQRLRDMVHEIYSQGQKLLVFASFSRTINLLRQELLLFQTLFPGSHVSELTGETPIDDRQAIVDVFNANQYPGSLILNPDAAGKGLNIQGANHVIHFNPEWNPALTNQATARAYRRGQELPVFVNHFFYSNTVEQDVIEKAQHKRDLAEAVDHGALE